MRSRLVTSPFDLPTFASTEGPSGLGAITNALQSLREEPPTTLGHCGNDHFDLVNGYEGLGSTDGVLLRLGERSRRGASVRDRAEVEGVIEITSPPVMRRHSPNTTARAALVEAVRADLESLLRL